MAREQGADAAGLAFDALKAARERKIDVLLIDTAGRLQNKTGLMEELAKVVRVIRKMGEAAPHAALLVLDATVGQNAISQVEAFRETAGVTGLVMTKLDGTARGGILVALAGKFGLPVHFIGVGEGVDDLEPFAAEDFARAIAGLEEKA
jgi:fused signal recognition particle receptor